MKTYFAHHAGTLQAYDSSITYQNIVESVRARENGGWNTTWCGHNGIAFSRYPNSASILDAWSNRLDTFADAANISREIAAAVIEDGEVLEDGEKHALSRHWKSWFNASFILSPKLSIIDPVKNKGRLRQHQLQELVNATEWDDSIIMSRYNAKRLLSELRRGIPVSYAAWWWCSVKLSQSIAQPAQPKRTCRLST